MPLSTEKEKRYLTSVWFPRGDPRGHFRIVNYLLLFLYMSSSTLKHCHV